MANPDEAGARDGGEHAGGASHTEAGTGDSSCTDGGKSAAAPSHAEGGKRAAPPYYWMMSALLTVLYLTVALYRISNLAFIAPDEPRYAGAGRTMAQGGSLLMPYFNGEARINKPPLFYWLVALSDWLCGGASETSARLPSVAMGLLMLWGTLALGRRVFGAATALIAGAVLISTPLFIALSRTCITDMTLSAFMAGSMGCLLLGMCGYTAPKMAGWIAAILLGLAMLTKATTALMPVVFVVAIARAMALPRAARPAAARWLPWIFAAALLFSAAALQAGVKRRHATKGAKNPAVASADSDESAENSVAESAPSRRPLLDRVLNPIALTLAIGAALIVFTLAYLAERRSPALPRMWIAGLAAAVLMALWWYIVLVGNQGWTRFRALLDFEFSQRLVGAVHREPMHYFLWMLPALTFPWSLGLPGAIARAWPRGLCGSGGPPEPNAESGRRGRADSFLLAWIAGIVFFFSIPGAKLSTYLMPAMPAFALLTARLLVRLWEARESVPRAARTAMAALGGVMALGVLALPFFAGSFSKNSASSFSSGLLANKRLLWPAALGAALLFPGAWLLALRGFARVATALLCGATLAIILLASGPAIEGLNSRSMKTVSEQVRSKLADCSVFVSLGVAPESLTYYLDHTVIEANSKRTGSEQGVEFVSKLLREKKVEGATWALFIDKRYYTRLFGGKAAALGITAENVAARLPENPLFEFVFANEGMLVVRNKKR